MCLVLDNSTWAGQKVKNHRSALFSNCFLRERISSSLRHFFLPLSPHRTAYPASPHPCYWRASLKDVTPLCGRSCLLSTNICFLLLHPLTWGYQASHSTWQLQPTGREEARRGSLGSSNWGASPPPVFWVIPVV